MRAIVVTCPHCGARLKTDATLVQVVCEYCGTSARLQRRTRVLERVIPAPPASNLPPSVATQRRTFVWPIVFMAGAIAVSGVVMAITVRARTPRAAGTPRAPTTRAPSAFSTTKSPAPPPMPRWEAGGPPLLADIDGDGSVEIIGRGREGDSVAIVAIDLSGKLRWKSEPLGTYDATYQGPLALANDLVLFAGMRGEVRAFALADGTPRWTATLGERTKTLCDAGSNVIAVGTDNVRRGLQLADGTPASVPVERKPTCKPLPTDKPAHVSNWNTRGFAEKRGIVGFDHELYAVPSGGQVLAGSRNTGTAVPTLVALDAAGKERWRVDVPLDPLGAHSRAPDEVVVGNDLVCAVYHPQSSTNPLDLTCFSLDDGRRIWNERLGSHYTSALTIVGDTLVISMWGNLEARHLRTGAVRWQFTERVAKPAR